MRTYDDTEYDLDDLANGSPYVVVERHEGGVAPLLLGIAIGAAAALLFAPRSGADTRRLIAGRARAAGDAARRKADELVDSVTGSLDDAREQLTEQLGAARSAARRQRDTMRDAFDAGRSAAHEARAELERKLAEHRQARREGQAS